MSPLLATSSGREARREIPVVLSGAMVRAILAGTKTEMRTPLKPFQIPKRSLDDVTDAGMAWSATTQVHSQTGIKVFAHSEEACVQELAISGCSPYGRPGQRLWVRETINMPRWASRLQLDVTSITVQRLHAMTDADCIAEGCKGGHNAIPRYIYNATPWEHFRHVWEVKGRKWADNPWVWVVSFRRVENDLHEAASHAQ